MDKSKKIIKKFFSDSNEELVIGGVNVSELILHFGTPMYVYDLSVANKTYERLRNRLSEDLLIFYSMKANPSLCLCANFKRLNLGGIEVASLGEMKAALKAGFSTNEILFAGPGKNDIELEVAIQSGILLIVESLEEIKKISQIAAHLKCQVFIALRINPDKNVSGSHLQMGGAPSPFGIDEKLIPDSLNMIRKHKRLNFQGIHIYVGNQIFDYQQAIDNIKNTIVIARSVAKHLPPDGVVRFVDLGGGLGIPYYSHESEFDEKNFAEHLNIIIKDAKSDPVFRETKFIMELGRYLVAHCGIFLTKILFTKKSKGKWFAITDGGMNVNSFATGNFGQKIRRKHPLCVANKLNAPINGTYNIVGPLCTPADSYGNDYNTPELNSGDIIAALNMGAYGFTGSPLYFLSHFYCPEVAIFNNKVQLIRESCSIEGILSQQHIFPSYIT